MKRSLPPSPHRRTPVFLGLASGLLCLAVLALLPAAWREAPKAAAEDMIMRLAAFGQEPTPQAFPITVIDIDSETIRRMGSWPWPRLELARIVAAIASRKPAVLGLDILLVGPDPRSPVQELLTRGFASDDPLVTSLRARVPDGDEALRAALAGVPSVAGIGLDPTGRQPAARALFLSAGPVRIDAIWRAGGAMAPELAVPEMTGLGVLALPAESDGMVRRVPLLAEAGNALHPGLALEVLRVAMKASAFILMPGPDRIMVGDLAVSLPHDGMLRLAPGVAEQALPRRISALTLLEDGKVDLEGHIVMLGASAPEAGGLRATADDVLVPSVWLQALALKQMMAGVSSDVPRQEALVLSGIALGLSVLLVFLPLALGPIAATISGCGLCAAVVFGAAIIAAASGLVINPLPALIVGPVAFLVSALAVFALARRQAARIRQRFEQHLSPDVVALIAANPDRSKLAGERRMITAVFTDIENFTELTERAGPEVLVSLLDRYFEGIVPIILRHGGTVDKIVGDAVHAFFNAPLDVDDHAGKALTCAREMLAWSDLFRQGEPAVGLDFGRTRIGIESGEAIVGDVGFGAKLDYTAHGYAVNAAARLEAANKTFGSSICIGPGAAELLGRETLRPLGPIQLRGISGEAMAYSV